MKTQPVMRNPLHLIVTSMVIYLLFSVSVCPAQNSDKSLMYQIKTKQGNIFVGKILKQDASEVIIFSKELGTIHISQANIKRILSMKAVKKRQYSLWGSNIQSTRYLFAPNGYGLEKNQGYYQNVGVLINSFAVGLGKGVSIGGGFIPMFLFGGGPTPVWVTTKVSIPVVKNKFNMGVGALMGTVLGDSESGFGMVYSISTFGTRDKNISVGMGYGYAGGHWAQTPLVNLSAMVRTGARSYLITENYFVVLDGVMVIISAGGRWMVKNVGLDYGLLMPVFGGSDTFVGIPWLGITIPFGEMPIMNPKTN